MEGVIAFRPNAIGRLFRVFDLFVTIIKSNVKSRVLADG
jgi:hypothetical protein